MGSAPSRAHDLLVGRSLGEFVLRERIGEGGFGAVYRATQPALDREAVIKVLHARLNTSKLATERFLREAKLASKLDHPYAAHIYAFGAEPDGQLWIAMELVRGTPLDQILKLQGPLSLERLVPLFDRICEVVHTAHEAGIVHRDLKPANVMVLSRAGRLLPKLLDFGIAKGLAGTTGGIAIADNTLERRGPEQVGFAETIDTPVPGLTQRGTIMGSPPYMAPEQWLDAGTADARTDLYALGIVAYECLVGKPPFMATTITAFAHAHAGDAPPPLGPRFPAALDKVIVRALAKDPAARFPDALAFAAALRQAANVETDVVRLPALDPALRDALLNGAPQPIAEAVAGFEAARNGHQARDALAVLGRTVARYLGLLAFACRSRISDDAAATETIRTLYRRALSEGEWIGLARDLTAPWIARRDAYPIPELVDAFHDGMIGDHLEALVALREAEGSADEVATVLEGALAHVTVLFEALAFLRDYPLVITSAAGFAERWMGVRRAQRSTIAVRGKGLGPGVVALLDRDGVPVLSLAPLFQVWAPTPGAPLELFTFEGRDRRGAKLVAMPSGFEHHDDALWDWVRVQLGGSLEETDGAAVEERAPYRGLTAFSPEDGAMFVGRERLVDAFVNRLKLSALLAVVGPSGAGKSSFVQAGVIPALAGWRAITLRPGSSPLAALVARLEHAQIEPTPEWTTGEVAVTGRFQTMTSLREMLERDEHALGHLLRVDAAKRGPIVLVIDQLEELFTLCQDARERRTFATAVAAAARATEDPVRVVFTLRDDFLVRTEQVPALRNRIGQGLQLLTVPSDEDLIRILVEPARRIGYELQGNLAADMVKEVADQPGALALISFTASKLWELRDRHFKQLTLAAYKTLGGVGGALARHAELTLDEMLPEERALTREAFRHLVTSLNTRAVLSRGELHQLLGGATLAESLVEKLVAARLLVASENEAGKETIEIVHEALLVAWPRLGEWRREDSEGARFREQLRSAAKQWDERGRERGLVWRGDALAELTRWRGRHTGPLTDVEGAFTDASLAEVARSRRNRRLLLAGSFAVLIAIVVGLIVFNTRIAHQREALHDNLQRQFEDQGRRLALGGEPLEALAYLTKAAELGVAGPAHDLLVAEAVHGTDGELLEIPHAAPLVGALRFSPDGNHLLTASFDGVARISNSRTGLLEHALHHDATVARVAYSADGDEVLTASFDGTAALWSVRDGSRLRQFKHGDRVWCAMFAPGGEVVTASADDTVRAWAGGVEPRLTLRGDGAGQSRCELSPDGTQVAATDKNGTTRIWDLRNGAPVATLQGHGAPRMLHYSPDGTRVLVASSDGTATQWDIARREVLSVMRHDADVVGAVYSADGARIATASNDHTAKLWDAATGRELVVLRGHLGGVNRAVFTADGARVVTVSDDTTVRMWDARTGRTVARWLGHRDNVDDLAFDPGGDRIATASEDGNAIVWRAVPQERVVWLVGERGVVESGAFFPDGTRVATAGARGVRVWDATTGRVLLELAGHTGRVHVVQVSPDGAALATAGDDATARIWDARTGAQLVALAGHTRSVTSIAWSLDGAALATSCEDGMLRAWSRDGALRFAVRAHDGAPVQAVAFRADGTIATSSDTDVRFWSADRGAPLGGLPGVGIAVGSASFAGERVLGVAGKEAKLVDMRTGTMEGELLGHVGQVMTAVWSPDGRFAVTSALDGTARVWNVAAREELLVFRHGQQLWSATFSPDGSRILTTADDGSAAIRDLALHPPPDLDLLMRCRVRFRVDNDHLANMPRDPVACAKLGAP